MLGEFQYSVLSVTGKRDLKHGEIVPRAQENGQNRDEGPAPCWRGCQETEGACVHEVWVCNDEQLGGQLGSSLRRSQACGSSPGCLQTGKHLLTRRQVGRCHDTKVFVIARNWNRCRYLSGAKWDPAEGELDTRTLSGGKEGKRTIAPKN